MKVAKAPQLQPQYYAQQVALSRTCMRNMSFNAGSLSWVDLQINASFGISRLVNTHRSWILGTDYQRKIKHMNLTVGKEHLVVVYRPMGVLGTAFFNYQSTRKVHYYQNSGHPDLVGFSIIPIQCCFLAEWSSSPIYICRFHFVEMFCSSWIGKYGAAGLPEWFSNLTPLDFFFRDS